ncbi:hypothetical protein FNV43_RR15001 [Rhamnella rubrinervis]|uniref:25S rRNA (uridine-N(3))-methyltransferase BMT5-like domain-containing protein n=1 Tax=Rhamnella rubrinervis TaxID=2594499 RepID=A0A8K0H3U5_9ROSA|nr:hypothetical protein FNV43_RR15001 [Rhamnella rubrinervis]
MVATSLDSHFGWLKERDIELIELHRELLEAFFRSARKMLSHGGEVHVTHRDDEPYKQWHVEKLALMAGLCLKEKVEFSRSDYPGYINKRGGLIKGNVTFPIRNCFTFKFCLYNNETDSSSIALAFDDDGNQEINDVGAVAFDDMSDCLAEFSFDSLE